MIKQLIFSGHVLNNESTIVDPWSIDRIYKACRGLGITGLKLYTDGGYLFIAEGSPKAVQTIKDGYDNHVQLSDLTVLLETGLEQPEFTDFKICFRKSDARANLQQCFTLNQETLDKILARGASDMTKILAKTFARVNNLLEA